MSSFQGVPIRKVSSFQVGEVSLYLWVKEGGTEGREKRVKEGGTEGREKREDPGCDYNE